MDNAYVSNDRNSIVQEGHICAIITTVSNGMFLDIQSLVKFHVQCTDSNRELVADAFGKKKKITFSGAVVGIIDDVVQVDYATLEVR